MSTDFFDDDLVSPDASASASAKASELTGDGRREIWKTETPSLPVSDLNLSRLARERQQLNGRVAGTVQEMEQLERRQNELEQRKHRLQELTRKQAEYEQGKRDMIQKLDRRIIVIEKEEIQASRRVDVLSEMRGRFKEALREIRDIDEERWAAEQFEEELDRALARVEEAALLYKKGLAKIDATDSRKGGPGHSRVAMAHDEAPLARAPAGFGRWLLAGIAFSLPISLVLIACFVVYLVLMGLVG